MKTKEFEKMVESIAPLSLAEEWDNSGWQIRISDSVKRVLVALEITGEIIDEAIEKACDCIVTHHPLYFTPIRSIDDQSVISAYTVKLIRNGISVYASHTPFDKCAGGNNDYLGKLLGFDHIEQPESDVSGFVRTGSLPEPAKLDKLIDRFSQAIGIDRNFVRVTGNPDALIGKAAWCSGAGSEFMDVCLKEDCQLFITGDLKYHQAREAKEKGIRVMDLGHFGTENCFRENMSEKLKRLSAGTGLEILCSDAKIDPFIG